MPALFGALDLDAGAIAADQLYDRFDEIAGVRLEGVVHGASGRLAGQRTVRFFVYCRGGALVARYADNPEFFTIEAPLTCLECLADL